MLNPFQYRSTVEVSDMLRLVEIAIALGLKPRVLLPDEPAAGVSSAESSTVIEVLGELPEKNAVLIIEHGMVLVLRFARNIAVLAQGSMLAEGTVAEITADAHVREVYLGDGHYEDKQLGLRQSVLGDVPARFVCVVMQLTP